MPAEPSVWAAVQAWFTPSVLFVLLNLVIGTIAVTSKVSRPRHRDDEIHHEDHGRLHRAPSILDRLKSLNLYRYTSGEFPVETATATAFAPAPSVIQSRSELLETFETLDEAYQAAVSESSQGEHFARSQSDSHPTAAEIPVKLAGKLKKSASAKSAFSHFAEADIPRRPDTVRVGARARLFDEGADEEVDAKADDFISRFRQQLKLQRLDSILRYKEMLTSGK